MRRNMRYDRRRQIACYCLAAVAACSALSCADGSTEPPPPGTLGVVLQSPNGPEGALLVEIDGPVQTVETDAGHLFRNDAEGRTQILIVLESAGEIGFRIGVANRNAPPEYRIIEVAGPDDQLRGDLSGYRLSFGGP